MGIARDPCSLFHKSTNFIFGQRSIDGCQVICCAIQHEVFVNTAEVAGSGLVDGIIYGTLGPAGRTVDHRQQHFTLTRTFSETQL